MSRIYALLALLGLSIGAANADVQFGAPSYEVREDVDVAVIDVVLTAQDSAGAVVTVNYRTVPGTATSPLDYQTRAGTLVWEMGDFSEKSIEIPIVDNQAVDGDLSFSVQLEDAVNAPLGPITNTSVLIADDDGVGPGNLQFAFTDLTVNESSGQLNIPVRRLGGTQGRVTAEITRVGGGTAVPGLDFSDTPALLVWEDGDDTAKVFDGVVIIDDAVPEPTATIQYEIVNPTGGVEIARGSLTITIVDNDPLPNNPGSIRAVASPVSVFESSSFAQVFVERVDGATGPASIDFITRRGTATFDDFIPTQGTVTWADQELGRKPIVIPIRDNQTPGQAVRSFFIDLSGVDGAALAGSAAIRVDIIDDDEQNPNINAQIVLQSPTVSVNDGQSSVNIPIAKMGNTTVGSQVIFETMSGSAIAGVDFVATSQAVTFPAGPSQVINVPVQILPGNNAPRLNDQSFSVRISPQAGVNVGAQSQAVVTIRAIAAQSRIVVSSPIVAVNQQAGLATVNVSRLNGASGTSFVDFETAPGSAADGVDYVAVDGQLVWQDGDSADKQIAVPLIANGSATGDRTFFVRLTNPVRATLGASTAQIVVSPIAPSTVAFAAPSVTVARQDGVANVSLVRTGPTGQAITVALTTQDQTAIAGVDYTALNTRAVSWAAGESGTKIVPISIAAGAANANDRTFAVTLEQVAGPVVASGQSIVRIAGTTPSTIGFQSGAVTATPGQGALTLALTRGTPAVGPASITFSVIPGSAQEGTDYTTPAQTEISWADGESGSKTIVIPLPQATSSRPIRTFTVRLQSFTGLVRAGAVDTVTVTLPATNAPPINWTIGNVSGNPAERRVTLTLSRDGNGLGAATAIVSPDGGTAVNGRDYVFEEAGRTVAWADGDTADKTVSVELLTPPQTLPARAFRLRITGVTGFAAVGQSSLATVSLPGVAGSRIELLDNATTVMDRSGAVSITLSRSGNSAGEASVRVVTIGGSARESVDFVPINEVVTWGDGDVAPKTVTVTLIPSAEPAPTKSFSLRVSAESGTAVVDSAEATYTVTVRSGASAEASGVSGCSAGNASGSALFMLMLTLAAAGLFRRRKVADLQA